jgi:putative transposase
MPRANRFILPGYLYHVTHRCHDRKFLFDAAVDRTEYRSRLGEALKRFMSPCWPTPSPPTTRIR